MKSQVFTTTQEKDKYRGGPETSNNFDEIFVILLLTQETFLFKYKTNIHFSAQRT